MKKSKVVLNVSGLSAGEINNFADSIYTKLIGNTNFTLLGSYLTALSAANTSFKTAIVASKDGTKLNTSTLHDAQYDVKRILAIIVATVNYEANGNETILISSGLDLRNYTPPTAKSFNAKQGKLSGSVDVEINSYGTAAYVWEMSTDPISSWTQVALTTLSKTTITGLTPGLKYWFKVSVTKGSELKAKSDPYMVHVV